LRASVTSTGTRLSLGYGGMVSRRKREPLLTVVGRERGGDEQCSEANPPNHRLKSYLTGANITVFRVYETGIIARMAITGKICRQ